MIKFPHFLPLMLLLPALLSGASAADQLPIIDAHSQLEPAIKPQQVIGMMKRAHVSRTILAARSKTSIGQIVSMAKQHPGMITAAVRTKSGAYQTGTLAKFKGFLNKQIQHPEFAAMAEVLIFHARKTNKQGKTIAPQVAFPPSDPKPQAALSVALQKGWPFIAHIEFRKLNARQRARYMNEMRVILRAHPRHPFLFIHMGQLGPEEAGQLLAAHQNLYFIPSHTTPITLADSHEPWTPMIAHGMLLPAWRDLILRYPDRFVLGFDNVWARHWKEFYIPQVQLWRQVLGKMPSKVAHKVAHRNAERLWHLPPAK